MKEQTKTAPDIRFRGFTGDWERQKWSDTVDISTDMVDPKSGKYDNLPHIAPGNIESFTGQLYDNIKTVKEEHLISGKFRFHPGDIVYGKINPQLGKYYFSNIEGLTSADAYVLNSKNGINQKFLFSVIQTEDFFKYSVAVSRRSGMPKINRDELNEYSFLAPSYAEQEKIGVLFSALDKAISLRQHQCDLLAQFKKGCLQNMFPQAGETVPHIRFRGFTGDWERRKLGDIADFNPSSELPDEFEYVDLESVVGTEMIGHRHETKSTAPSRAQRLAKQGDLFFQTVRPYQKNNYLFDKTDDDYVFSTGYAQMRPHVDGKFLLSLVQTEPFVKIVLDNCTGTSYPAINANDLARIDVTCPHDKAEGEKIGAFFSTLDRSITLHRREIEDLQTAKKFMLQNLFV